MKITRPVKTQLVFPLVFSFAACASQVSTPIRSAPQPQSKSSVVGYIDGVPLTHDEFFESSKSEMAEQENEFLQRRLHLTWVAFEEKIGEVLAENAAKKKGISAEAMWEQDVYSKLPKATDEQAKVFYDANTARIGADFDAVKDAVKKELDRRAREEAEQAFLAELRRSAAIRYTLPVPELPRVEVPTQGYPTRGSKNPKVMIVEFADYECPYCVRARNTLKELAAAYPKDVAMVFRDFPLAQHANAKPAAQAAFCAKEQGKYWEYHDLLFDHSDALSPEKLDTLGQELNLEPEAFKSCRTSERAKNAVETDLRDGETLGVRGTPTLYINGIKLIGLLPIPVIRALIDNELASSDSGNVVR